MLILAEELVLPYAKDIVSIMMGGDYLINYNHCLSIDTVRRRIQDMADYIWSQVADEIKSCPSSAYN
jgi:hypothetical protein